MEAMISRRTFTGVGAVALLSAALGFPGCASISKEDLDKMVKDPERSIYSFDPNYLKDDCLYYVPSTDGNKGWWVSLGKKVKRTAQPETFFETDDSDSGSSGTYISFYLAPVSETNIDDGLRASALADRLPLCKKLSGLTTAGTVKTVDTANANGKLTIDGKEYKKAAGWIYGDTGSIPFTCVFRFADGYVFGCLAARDVSVKDCSDSDATKIDSSAYGALRPYGPFDLQM